MDESKTYVRVDPHGVYRVGGTRVMLDSIVAAFHLRSLAGDDSAAVSRTKPGSGVWKHRVLSGEYGRGGRLSQTAGCGMGQGASPL